MSNNMAIDPILADREEKDDPSKFREEQQARGEIIKQQINNNIANNKKVKILWYGDSPYCATGFGNVARNIIKTLDKTDKFEGTCIGINDWGQAKDVIFKNFKIDSGLKVGNQIDNNVYRYEFLKYAVTNFPFDILFTLQDTFVLQNYPGLINYIIDMKRRRGFQWIFYFPIDGEPMQHWFNGLENVDYLVTYTEWAKKQIEFKRPDLRDKILVINHGINERIFYPLQEPEKEDFKQKYFNLKNVNQKEKEDFLKKKIITNINRNQPRKDPYSTIRAFYELKKIYPNVLLYLHMKTQDIGGNLIEMCRNIGLRVGLDVVFPGNFDENIGFPVEVMNGIYNISDIIVSSHLGEGWGLSSTEAFATMTPVVFPYNTASIEILGSSEISDTMRGVPIKSGGDIYHESYILNDNPILRPFVHIEDMVKKMDWVLDESNKDKVYEMTQRAFNWVHERTWSKINKKWLDICIKAGIRSKIDRNNIIQKLVKEQQKKENNIELKEKIGRNQPCPCGSKKKYKYCCGKV